MKYVMPVFFSALLMFTCCSDSGGGGAAAGGSPGLSPENITEAAKHFDEASGADVPVEAETAAAESSSSETAIQESKPAPEDKAVTGETTEGATIGTQEGDTTREKRVSAEKKHIPVNVTAELTGGKWSTSPEQDGVNGGIYTLWEKEPIHIAIHNLQVSGWYEIAMEAKNVYGPLPVWYRYFTINVANEILGKDLGAVFIPASDAQYGTGALRIYIDKGDTALSLTWQGDAYDQGNYDTNILIRKVSIHYIDTQPAALTATAAGSNTTSTEAEEAEITKSAKDYSAADGRWFWDKDSGWTHGPNQYLGFNFPKLAPGKYRITIYARNKGTLPKHYTHFEVQVSADGVDGIAKIPAHENKYHSGSVNLDLTGGNTDLFINWLNDEYEEGEHDTNIQVSRIVLKKIGRSERSAFGAYMLGTSQGNRVLIFGALALVMIIIGVLFIMNKKRAGMGA